MEAFWLAFGNYRGRSVKGFLPYLYACIQQRNREEIFRLYICSVVQIAANNVSGLSPFGRTVEISYAELLNRPQEAPDADEITRRTKEAWERIRKEDA